MMIRLMCSVNTSLHTTGLADLLKCYMSYVVQKHGCSVYAVAHTTSGLTCRSRW